MDVMLLGQLLKDENGQHSVGDCYYSKFTTFSFHPIKNITTGEGGCITTNDKKILKYSKMSQISWNGKSTK